MGSDAQKAARFVEHLEPLQGALEAYCRRNLNDHSDAEDVLQSAVANAFRDFQLYVESTNFRAWIFRYLNLEIIAWNRKRRPLASAEAVEHVAAEPMSWEAALASEAAAALRDDPDWFLDRCDAELARVLQELPEMERSTLLLRAIGEFSYREIGEVLEIPVGSVMGYLSRARARLRLRLADYCRESGFLRDNKG